MEFFKALTERDFNLDQQMNDILQYRQFKPIQISDDLWISIQASSAHSCTPRANLEALNEYTHWEFGLFNKYRFLTVREVLPNFPSLVEIEYYYDRAYEYVPTDLVEEFYNALKPNRDH